VPPPAAGKIAAGRTILSDGRAVVFAVTRIIPGNPADATPPQKAQLQQQLTEMAGSDDVEGMVKALRKRAVVTIAEDRL
jgi:peptidyl-prolyl cis-trans isomerase D